MNPGIEFETIDSELLRDRYLTAENFLALIKYGFIGWASPHLYFGSFKDSEILPTLANWSWVDDWDTDKNSAFVKYGRYIVVGSGPDNEPIVYKQNESPIYLISNNQDLFFLNSNIDALVHTASAFLDMVDHAVELDQDSMINCSVPARLVNKFLSELDRVEKKHNK